ncbi:CD20-like domain-containing protein [Streptococcus sp. Marseille-Q0941]|uniref:CD20-like domain-containing protein n=1 Tax=Streptococcus sp. Marseille-Q0941 TaxID=2942206 RepID=UPI0020736927|nr:CD20-like domain-containing protein [Streptococcus sp. Marseille-Q0941]
MKQKEEKILGILAIIFGALALLGSWLPIISILAFFFAIIAIALGVFGISLNLNNRKTLAIIGTSLGILSVFLVFMTQVLPSGVFTDLAKNFRHPYSSLTSLTEDEEFRNLPDYKSDEDKNEEDSEDTDTFSWTQEQFDALIEGDTTNRGKGGTNYKDIISKHGLPDSEFESTSSDYEIKKITYLSLGSSTKTVVLTFVKQENGQFLLIRKFALGLDRKEQTDDGVKV